MSNFDVAVAFTLHEEDQTDTGVVTTDSGGVTRWGISQRANPQLTEDQIRNLSRDDAIAIYKIKYWRDAWESLPVGLALCVFDCSVNQGPGTAQMILDSCHHDLKTFLAMRIRHYTADKEWPKDGLGWTTRVLTCLQAAISLV